MKFIAPIHSVLKTLVCCALAMPQTGLSQGVLLRPGQWVEASFSTMRPGTHDLNGSTTPGWELNGTLTVSRNDLPFAFRADLINDTHSSPIWSYVFNVLPGEWSPFTSTFGVADGGSPWAAMAGSIRVTYLYGPPVTLTELIAYQSFLVDGTLRSYEAIIPVTEPSIGGLACIAAVLLGNCRALRPR